MADHRNHLGVYLSLNVLTPPVVHTKQGSLRGQYLSVKGKEIGVHAFLGVPFAEPPVGPLRLAPPRPSEGWEGVRDATQQPHMCTQYKQLLVDLMDAFGLTVAMPDISEDCLYLNIYKPAKASKDAKLPVMVWIHGGGLTSGAASLYDGSALAAYQDAVVVLLQYRLGPLGFLSTGDEHIPGNLGLLDQVEALRWVQKHSHNFGGDQDSVTIFGESAGGTSVSILLLSPLSVGLFHKAIAESGTAAMDLLYTKDPLPMAQMAANKSGCGITSTKEIADCMRQLDNDAVLTLVQDPTLRFQVSADGQLLKKPVDELLKNHEILNIPFITGVNNDEGGWLLPSFFAPPNWTEGMDRNDAMTSLAIFFPDPKDEDVKEVVADVYLGTSGDRVEVRNGFTELIGDIMFTIPAIRIANIHRDAGAAMFLYEYQHSVKFLQEKRPSFVKSDHGDELLAVLGFCFTTNHVKITGLCTEEEEHHSRIVMSYWGNFARTGSPNGAGLVHWPQYGAEEDYLSIGLKQVPGQHLKKDRFIFLTQTIPEMIRQRQQKKKHNEL
ncbi:fatty acyl-CoA hydrolase precursor, medium chain-like [Lampris incognitus]|uniref:fatty acyl-CoA hydrolase precursor, medium chain-like n=1 Tax=Lampris incognitus TaxID=2546036 RepID=UPI0024B4F3A3|nr:fatty acyl-CoA hydrolase precursor, medium chain-like [Lampris incognitus]